MRGRDAKRHLPANPPKKTSETRTESKLPAGRRNDRSQALYRYFQALDNQAGLLGTVLPP